MTVDSSKRRREYEDLPDTAESFIHERKKHRPLALRTSPKFSQQSSYINTSGNPPWFGLSNITPVQSSDEDEDGYSLGIRTESIPVTHQPPARDTRLPISSCVPMDIDNGPTEPNGGGWSINKNNIHPSLNPAYPASTTGAQMAFAHEGGQQTIHSTLGMGSRISQYAGKAVSNDLDCAGGQGTAWLYNPRLSSPVSDSGDVLTGAKPLSNDTDMSYGLACSKSPALLEAYHMETEPSGMQCPISSSSLPNLGKPICSRASPTLSKKPGFSMGYRADCDKCRRRVPGHYVHILRT